MFLVHVCILLTYNVEEADPSLGGGCVDLAHVCALVRVLYIPDVEQNTRSHDIIPTSFRLNIQPDRQGADSIGV